LEFNSYEDFIEYCKNTSLVSQQDETENIILAVNEFVKKADLYMEYAPISTFVFNSNDEDVEIVQHNLEAILNTTLIRDPMFDHALIVMAKVADHINLAVSQKRLVEDVVLKKALAQISNLDIEVKKLSKDASTSINDVETFKTGLREMKKEVVDLRASLNESEELSDQISKTFENLKLDKTKIYTDFVSILGIFATIIFAAFGGLNLLSGIFDNLKDVRVGKLFIFSSLIIGAIISMLFILLNGIAKLTGLNLKSCNCYAENKDCNHHWVKQHPSIVIISVLIALIFLEGTLLYFVEYRELIEYVNKGSLWLQATLLFVPFIGALLLWFTVIKSKLTN
jgi:hypothetical protein